MGLSPPGACALRCDTPPERGEPAKSSRRRAARVEALVGVDGGGLGEKRTDRLPVDVNGREQWRLHLTSRVRIFSAIVESMARNRLL